MRLKSKSLHLVCLLALASCTAGEITDAPPNDTDRDPSTDASGDDDNTDDNTDDAEDASTTRRDAGLRDASTRDAGSTTAKDASASVVDAGQPAATHDAGPTTGSTSDAGTLMSEGETGRMIGMTAAHNAVRAMVQTTPMLADMTWDPDAAAYAQEWADSLAATSCSAPHHRTGAELQAKGYGENLATFGSSGANASTAQQAVNGWSAEVACWTYGTIEKTEKCDVTCYTNMHSDGCGHYTQVVWRKSIRVGCGVSTCKNGNFNQDIWICNYAPAGNYVGQAPY